MIRVLCLNPVIDRMYYIDDFSEGVKFFEIKPDICIGGKGVNIARVMSIMGEPCELYGFIGGSTGELVREEMERYKITFKAFEVDGDTRTTINIIDGKKNLETEITEPGAKVDIEATNQFLAVLEADIQPGDMVICSGIPMTGMDENIYHSISKLCENNQCYCILDTTGIYLKKSIPGKYFFMKPNFEELAELFSKNCGQSEQSLLHYGKKLLNTGVENLLISTGETGGIFLNEDYVLKASIPKTEVVSTIGSGDSTVAGFCIGIQRKMPLADCVKLAMACGVCNAKFSKVGYVEKEIVESLYSQIEIEQLDYTD